ncbi:receptor-like protein 12 [Cinnamomum micranthum f. kanehirae]|uniref:Receptor-like protein 12 n=1 Tax=Cinnamomum micranthum f. kanehirae TaxID=337451 RepID=A0A3S4NLS6_9MAGN|nr:receptor-like protein 12 [Cinnamomum micranthum f. kanehirae]
MRFPLTVFQVLFILFLFSSNSASTQCLDNQKFSLLTLFGSAPTPSWTPRTDCCSWKGVTCDGSGHVTGLDLTNSSIKASINSTSLTTLSSLRNLNLSLNFFDSSIPVSLSRLSKLTHLNLSNSASKAMSRNPAFAYVVGNLSFLRELYLDTVDISSPVPESLVGLAHLTSLHLSLCNLTGQFPWKIFQLQNLKTLDLSSNQLLSGTLPEFPLDSKLRILSLTDTNFRGELPNSFGNLRYLQRLQLQWCNFSGRIPLSLGLITQLVDLDISGNNLSGEISSLGNLTQLVHLDISSNSFDGEIQSLENLTELIYLDLSGNKFSGSIPFLEKLTQLVRMDLSSNCFSGGISFLSSLKNVEEIALSNNNLSSGIDSSYVEGLLNLRELHLHNNSLNGKVPSSLFGLPSLQYLDLSHNQFYALPNEFSDVSSSLNSLYLSNNQLQGPVPRSVFLLVGLKNLILSSNNFSGTVDLSMLQNLKNLSSLDLSNNRLSINTSGTNSSFPQIGQLKLSSCNLTEFPNFLTNQSILYTLDLSNNKIDGEIPRWIWKTGNWSLNYLNLSHNMLSGLELPIVDLSLIRLHVIPANIFLYLSYGIFFSLAGNNITGEIPSSICNAIYLEVLDLSNNNLRGSIPHCLGELNYLQVLNLGKNNLHGVIPQSFGYGCGLKTLNLNQNQLEGSLPESLANCKQLEVLNIGNNWINDSFPLWLGTLQQLRVLILRSNMFHGPIQQSEDQNAFSQLHIIDLSSNSFTGNLSCKWFQSLKGMKADKDEHEQNLKYEFMKLNPLYYQESATVTLKGLEMEFLKILTIFTSVDLSNNRFQGSIPEEIGNLKSLIVLNMSHNEFVGPIPSSFGNLLQLESLDLSMNRLSGEIPIELAAQTFLSVLNLSQNHFMGRIPQARQFLTFANDSFQGNPGLCGPPLSRQCEAPWQPGSASFPSGNSFDWQFLLAGLGFGFGLDLANHSIRAPINSTSLISLSSLRNLDLSDNSFFNSSIPISIGALSNLTHLNLSNSNFIGLVPVELSLIKGLESLDLSCVLNGFERLRFLGSDFGYVVGNLSGLRELYLDGVNISSPAPEPLGMLANLTSLHLSSCNLIGEFPMKIFQLQNLETIDLSANSFLSVTLPEFPSYSKLQILSLSSTNFKGELPNSFGNLSFSGKIPSLENLTQLVHLDLSFNNFGGEIPSLENLAQLEYLGLSSNNFGGEIPSLENLTQLVHLDLSSNNFGGEIPSLENLAQLDYLGLSSNWFSGEIPSLEKLAQLGYLGLSSNRFSGEIPSLENLTPSNRFSGEIPSLDEFVNASSSLLVLDLSNNMLQGPIPSSLFKLTGLEILRLSSNNLSGTMNLLLLQNIRNLSYFSLSNNRLSINASGTSTSFPQLLGLELSSCNLREFPQFLKNQSELYYLDLSNNRIDGEIPNWIWWAGNGYLSYLNLSHNLLYSLEEPTVDLSLSHLLLLDLNSNKLQGSVPIPPPSVAILDYSHNNFSSLIPTNISMYFSDLLFFFSLSDNNIGGEIPTSLCNAINLTVLDMSKNNLKGLIPQCLVELHKLRVLNLEKNDLCGVVPDRFGHGCSLQTLNLNKNRLEGSLPMSLTYCKQLEVLNIGNNGINDSFPSWLGSLEQLRVLVLRSNKFHGPIHQPEDRNAFSKLYIIDLSSNGFTGNLSLKWFQKLKGMMDDELEHKQILGFSFSFLYSEYYQDRVTITVKGKEMEFFKILTILSSMDLSNNKFHGRIPKEIGNLNSLYMLNMSNNEFNGPIPSSLGNLRQLESLDLSMNRLSGEIPIQLTALSFLSVINLSQNCLVGRIPQAQQFLTFANDSFEGNPGLCGAPLSKQCEAPLEPAAPGEPRSAKRPLSTDFDWRFICAGLGFGFGNWMIMGPVIFWPRGRRWYYRHVDEILAMATVWWDMYIVPLTTLKQRASD